MSRISLQQGRYGGKDERYKDYMKFENLNISSEILRGLEEMGFSEATPIQEQSIPEVLQGKDLIGQAQTGTGKTCAYGIPAVQMTDPHATAPQVLTLCPTRELASQVADEFRRLTKYMQGIRILAIYGGQSIENQIAALKKKPQIIIGTPGRVMDHMRRRTLRFDHLKMLILDEADEMLNMGFREDIEAVLSQIPEERQTVLFSATMPPAILAITKQYQKGPVLVQIQSAHRTVDAIAQYYVSVPMGRKTDALQLLLLAKKPNSSMIFCNTKKMVDELAEHLKDRGYQAEGLHGDMTQKQRDFVMNRFKNGSLQVLIATDVAARGIDVDDLEAVFNYDVPQDTEYYVHRIGRTGRAGREGLAFTFAYGRDLYRIREIERVCKTKMTEQKLPKSAQVMDIKLNKLLQAAKDTLDKEDYVKLQDQIEEKMEDYELDPMELLAYLVRKEIGEAPEEIVIEEPRKRRSSFDDRRKRFTDDDRRKRFADDGGHKSRVFGRGDKEGSRRGGSCGDRERSDRSRERSSRRDGARGEREGSDRSRERNSRRDGSRGERKGNRK